MPMMAFGLRRDRLAIRHARRTRFDFELELARHALEHDLVDLGDSGKIAGNRLIDFDVLRALRHEQVRDFERLAAVADEELRVFGHRTLMNAKDAHLADERIHDDLEYVREDMPLRIRFRAKFCATGPLEE